jgi:Protein of unknown function (DUF3048) N-terminal domain
VRHPKVGLPATAAVLGGLVVLVLLTACSGSPTVSPSGSPTSASPTGSAPSTPAASGSPAPTPFGRAPLTGLPQASAGAAARPAVTVVVDVRAGGAAPVGLNRADLVFAEYDDPGSSRLLAVFQSQLATEVGPVGQTRSLDPKLVPLWGGPYAYAGGPKGFVGRLAPAGVVDAGLAARPAGYHRGAGGILLASTPALLAATPPALMKGLHAPAGYLTYGTDGQGLAAAGVTPATTATLVIPGRGSQVWTCDPATGRWQQPQLDVSVSTLAVRLTAYEKISLNHGVAPFTLTPKPFGTGAATLLSGCQRVGATWSQPGATRTVNFIAAGNQPIWLVPGPAWIVFAPPGTTVQVS